MDERITTKQAAQRTNMDERTIRRLCVQGRIPGAVSYGDDAVGRPRIWLVPADAVIVRRKQGRPRTKRK